ncbi:MAG: hypothetical protein WBV94_00345 [Blastocatellia bacterium]
MKLNRCFRSNQTSFERGTDAHSAGVAGDKLIFSIYRGTDESIEQGQAQAGMQTVSAATVDGGVDSDLSMDQR